MLSPGTRYYSAYAATWIWGITSPTRNEMNVAVHHRLASDRTAVDSNVETQDSGVFLEHEISRFSEQLLAGTNFGGSKVKIVRSMPLRDNK